MKQAKLKLNQQGEVDITIPEIKEKVYTKTEILKVINDIEANFEARVGGDSDYGGVWEFTEALRKKFDK